MAGVESFHAALAAAGARTVTTSPWKVDDLATRLLMIDFHRRPRIEGESTREALDAAKSWLRTATLEEVQERRGRDPEWRAVRERVQRSPRVGQEATVESRPFDRPRYWAAWASTNGY